MNMSLAIARPRRAGRAAIIVAALGLALSAVPSAAWADTESAPGQSQSTGQPCDGCVGNADDKTPPGQSVDGVLDGSDLNAGYECDRNHGVGRGNPAHTACIFS
jgi:hypothetical protein